MPIIETNNYYGYIYRKNEKHSKSMPKIFKIILICIILFLVLVGAYLISGKVQNILGFSESYFDNTKLYSISVGNFSDYQTAKTLSGQLQKQGGAGYVYNSNGSFYVLVSMYEKKEDCLSVIENLKLNNIEATMLEINLKKMEIDSNFNEKQKEYIKNALNSFLYCYRELYKLSIEFDKSEVVGTDIVNKIDLILQKFNNDYELFSKNCATSSNASMVYLKVYLSSVSESLNSLKSKSDNFGAEIKWIYIDIIMKYCDFRQEV